MKRSITFFIAVFLCAGSAWGNVHDSTFRKSSGPSSPIPVGTYINAGTDSYTATQATFSFGESGDYPSLPANFFGPGSEPFAGTLFMQGPNSGGSQTPDADVAINRTTSLTFSDPPSMGMVQIQMTQFSLVSVAPILVSFDVPPIMAESFFDVFFEISIPSDPGMANILLADQYGGTFGFSQPFRPVITFVNTANPSDVHIFNAATMGLPPLLYMSTAPYPWTLSPIAGEFDPIGNEDLVLHTLAGSTISLSPLLERTDNNFTVNMNQSGVVESYSGNGFYGGEWFYYPYTNWWNVWWYDHPMAISRIKYILNPVINVLPRNPQLPSSVTIVYTYSTSQWLPWTIAPRPPLPQDVPNLTIENQLIQRTAPLYSYTGTISQAIPVPLTTPYLIPYYNPEWISIDIRGNNFILNGLLNHVCFKPAERSVDFGDAPAPYPTFLANNGARHTIFQGAFMGAQIDAEADGLPNANATGDDLNNLPDEDGVIFNSLLNPGLPATLTVQSTIANALLQGWIDFNADGDWNEAGEQIMTNVVTVAGNNVVIYNVPAGATPGLTFARFRLSTMPNLSYTGAAPNGEVEDYKINIETAQQLDFGDAPDQPYPTLLAGNGARHIITGLKLGVLVDAEPNGQPNGTATGDDNNPPGANDEDGVWWGCNFVPGHVNTVRVTASGPGFLNAWFDYNIDGDWTDPGEQVFTNVAMPAGTTDLFVSVPAGASIGNTFARFRFSTQLNLGYTGLAQDGEVEDYMVTIDAPHEMDYGDAPDPAYPTLAASNGARHGHDPNIPIFLGNLVDWEINGQPNATATGDDVNNLPDEDGVVFNTPVIPGGPSFITVTASIGGGFFQGWIDFNADGDWSDPGEQIYTNVVLVAGAQPLNFNVPVNAVLGNTFARFRYSTMPNLSCYGCAPNGEVEDYLILIEPAPPELDFGDAPDPAYPTLLANNGARHIIDNVTYLGALIDAEADGQPSVNADGDDLSKLDDEDGVIFMCPLAAGNPCKLKVTASVGDALLNCWIDFNRNGSWADAGEHVFTDLNLLTGINYLNFITPCNAVPGVTYARFRFSHQPALSFTGQAFDGEVEDYATEVMEYSDTKWLQPPDPLLPGMHAGEGSLLADDWVCCGDVVTDIHWWGNYETAEGGLEKRGSGINHFLVQIYSNANCLPNAILKSYIVPFTPVLETNTGIINNEGSYIYKYDYQLPEPFIQVKDTTYWLSVSAISNDPQNPPYWRWQEANRWIFPIHCGAVISAGTQWARITWPFPPLVKYDDFAFSITSWVVDNLNLQNINVTNGQDICYDAKKVITVAGGGTTFNVFNGGRATIIAGEKISYLPTTKVYLGGYMSGHITTTGQYCSSLKTAIVANSITKPDDNQLPEMINGQGFRVYPNPTTGKFKLEVTGTDEPGDISVEIYTMFGKKVQEVKLLDLVKYEFSLSTQAPGVYILRVITGKDAGTVKIIRQ